MPGAEAPFRGGHYCMGGDISSYAGTSGLLSTVERYAPTPDVWVQHRGMPFPHRSRFGAFGFDCLGHVFGGSGAVDTGIDQLVQKNLQSSMRFIPPDTWSWSTPVNRGTFHSSQSVIGDIGYVYGGTYLGSSSDRIRSFHPFGAVWAIMTDDDGLVLLPDQVSESVAGTIDGNGYIASGYDRVAGGPSRMIAKWNPIARTASLADIELPTGTSMATGSAVNGSLHIFGGYNYTDRTFTRAHHKFTPPGTLIWEIQTLAPARKQSTSFADSVGPYLIGGFQDLEVLPDWPWSKHPTPRTAVDTNWVDKFNPVGRVWARMAPLVGIPSPEHWGVWLPLDPRRSRAEAISI